MTTNIAASSPPDQAPKGDPTGSPADTKPAAKRRRRMARMPGDQAADHAASSAAPSKPATEVSAIMTEPDLDSQIVPHDDAGTLKTLANPAGGSQPPTKHKKRTPAPEPAPQAASASAPQTEQIEAPLAISAQSPRPRRSTKAGLLVDMLRRPEGTTIDQMIEATGWLAHTARAALTGLRKQGHAITSDKPEGKARVYRVQAKADLAEGECK